MRPLVDRHAPWSEGGWQGRAVTHGGVDPEWACSLVEGGGGRESRHARTFPCDVDGRRIWVKVYAAPGARHARRAFRMGLALTAAGFAAPRALLVGSREGEGLLVTEDVGGAPLLVELVGAPGSRKRMILCRLGAEVGRLHVAGFVHGDLVPSNILVREGRPVFLDHDRTRRNAALVWWQGRRNLVQLGRFVVPGLSASDRARVLDAYATERGWAEAQRRRLARWVMRKVTMRRCEIDGIDVETAERAGFRALMRSGGPFDPAVREGGGR